MTADCCVIESSSVFLWHAGSKSDVLGILADENYEKDQLDSNLPEIQIMEAEKEPEDVGEQD